MPSMIWRVEALWLPFQVRVRPWWDVDHVPGSPQQEPVCQT